MIWHGCYDSNWRGMITDNSWSHPAKFARGLIERIYEHGFERGYWNPGDLICDPFSGIATGGIVAAYRGLAWVGVELEEKFVGLAKENFELHRRKWEVLGVPQPRIIQGDSRRLCEVIADAEAIVCSPPYADRPPEKSSSGVNIEKQWATYRSQGGGLSLERFRSQQQRHSLGYGQTPGQLGAMPAGSVEAVVTSPPFAQGYASGGGINKNGYGPNGEDKVGNRTYQGTGGERSPGNIECMPPGDVAGIVTSPPWEDQEPSHAQAATASKLALRENPTGGTRFHDAAYGQSAGQLGNESGTTYWEAVCDIYRQCLMILRPGGVLACVVKSYVKNKSIVDLPGQTWDLLQRIGFEPVERVRASLVKRRKHAGLFGDVEETKERKSFFRRLAEKKGSPRIDFEHVLFVGKP